MRIIFLTLLASFCGPRTWAQEDLRVVDVRRQIQLSNDEAVIKDYYITGTSVESLKPKQEVVVNRRLSVRDSSGSQNFGEVLVPVGILRVIAQSGRVAIARETSLLSREDLPMLEQRGIMVGDLVNLKLKPQAFKRDLPAVAPVVSPPHGQAANPGTDRSPTALGLPQELLQEIKK